MLTDSVNMEHMKNANGTVQSCGIYYSTEEFSKSRNLTGSFCINNIFYRGICKFLPSEVFQVIQRMLLWVIHVQNRE